VAVLAEALFQLLLRRRIAQTKSAKHEPR
jgi:hypothetical protein